VMYTCCESMCKCENHNLKKSMASMLRCLAGLSIWEIFHIEPQFCIMLQDLKQVCYLFGTPLANNELMHKGCQLASNKMFYCKFSLLDILNPYNHKNIINL